MTERARLDRATQYPEALVIEPGGRGVLDTPLARGMTTLCEARLVRPKLEERLISLCQQHRVGAVHGFGAVDHRLLQRRRLHRNIFGKEPRQRDIALGIAACFVEIARGE